MLLAGSMIEDVIPLQQARRQNLAAGGD